MTEKKLIKRGNLQNKIKMVLLCSCFIICFITGTIYASKKIQNSKDNNLMKVKNIEDIKSNDNSKSINLDDLPLADKVVVVDAGHGGADPGTMGPITGVYEADINLKMSYMLKSELEELGADVIMTRTEQSTEELGTIEQMQIEERGKIIEDGNPDMVLSIHQNFNEDSNKIRGAQILYREKDSLKLAANLQDAFNNELNTKLNYLMGRYHLLKFGDQPSVIVECGFLSNPEEEKLLATDEYQKRIVGVIVKTVVDYYK